MHFSKSLRSHGIRLVVGLFVQGAFGMITASSFPESGTPSALWQFMFGHLAPAIHSILGLLILVGALSLMIRAFKTHNSAWKLPSVIGFVALLVANYGGVAFVQTTTELYSTIMTVALLVTLAAYGWGIVESPASTK